MFSTVELSPPVLRICRGFLFLSAASQNAHSVANSEPPKKEFQGPGAFEQIARRLWIYWSRSTSLRGGASVTESEQRESRARRAANLWRYTGPHGLTDSSSCVPLPHFYDGHQDIPCVQANPQESKLYQSVVNRKGAHKDGRHRMVAPDSGQTCGTNSKAKKQMAHTMADPYCIFCKENTYGATLLVDQHAQQKKRSPSVLPSTRVTLVGTKLVLVGINSVRSKKIDRDTRSGLENTGVELESMDGGSERDSRQHEHRQQRSALLRPLLHGEYRHTRCLLRS